MLADTEYSSLASNTHGEYSKRKNGTVQTNRWSSVSRALVIMTTTMAIGTASAIAQHVVFRHYDYQAVRSSTEQKWIGRVGTGLAFLCKTLLATACNTAYVQYLWMLARVRPASVSSLDAMYDVLSNALSFSQLAVWTKRPFLLLIAIISWSVTKFILLYHLLTM